VPLSIACSFHYAGDRRQEQLDTVTQQNDIQLAAETAQLVSDQQKLASNMLVTGATISDWRLKQHNSYWIITN
jgi:hypothetical protein